MRHIAWGLLLLFAFAIPWEYSLDLGEPLGNIARLVGLFVLLAAIPAVLASGRLRASGADALAGAGLLSLALLLLFLDHCATGDPG